MEPARPDPETEVTANRAGIALLVLLLVQVAAVGAFWFWELPRSHQVEIGEGPVLTVVQFARSGHPLYSHPTGLPLIQNPYGPVFEWLCVRLPELEASPYLTGRAISLAASVALAILLARWLLVRRASRLEILVVLALFMTTKPWILFGALYRVDALAVLLSVLGFLLAVSRSRGAVAAAVPVFVVALAIKLTALAAPVAAAAFLWTTDRKRAVWFTGALGVCLPGSVLALQSATDGAYLLNASFGNAPSHWLKGFELPSRILVSLFWLLAAVGLLRRQAWKDHLETRALTYYAITSLLVAAVFATNPLSSWNYLMEFYVALAALTGLLLVRSRRDRGFDRRLRTRMLTLLAAHAAVALLFTAHTITRTTGAIRSYQVRYELARARIEPIVRQGRSVLVLDSPEGKDVLNGLGRPNLVSLPASVERRAEIQKLIRRSMEESVADVVFEGSELRSSTGGGGSAPIRD